MTRVTIIGAGPVGLDAALAFVDAGAEVTVLEAGPSVGTHVRAWGHVRLFTPWSMTVSDRMARRLAAAGQAVSPARDDYPTGEELVARLLDPVAALPALDGVIRTGVRVLGVARRGLLKHQAIGAPARKAAPFRLLLTDGAHEWSADADLVLDATGTWATPTDLGDGGVPAPGERAVADRIVRHLPRPATLDAWAGQRVLLVGAGKSAQTAARDLAEHGVGVLWAVRDPAPDWGAIPEDSLPGRQALVDSSEHLRTGAVPGVEVWTGAQVAALRSEGDGVGARIVVESGSGDRPGTDVTVDRVVALTGYGADPALYRELQVHECYATGAPMGLAAALLAAAGDGPADCLAQPAQGVDVLRSPEPDFFVVGAKSYGRNNAFLLRVGYAQVDEIVAAYAATVRAPVTA